MIDPSDTRTATGERPVPSSSLASAQESASSHTAANLPRILEEQADPVFFGLNGLGALWRLPLFFAIQSVTAGVITLLRRLGPPWLASPATTVSVLTSQYFLIVEPVVFAGYFLATWIMGKLERRTMADYGLPASGLLGRGLWLGLAAGFASVSTLLGTMRLAGALHFDGVALHGSEAWTHASLWALAFLLVGLQEEFRGRGYVLFTLATGVGFWPAALITSFWFGYTHRTNSGETPIGLLSVGASGMLFCILVCKTGDLWLPIGFHAAWDFGLTYVYGVPDSGLAETGHLLNSHFSGPAWLTGGSAGPEASLVCLILILVLSVATLLFFPPAKYPNPAGGPDPRHRKFDSQAQSSALSS
jgi:membrane protease YdiL (CAAX protease family)